MAKAAREIVLARRHLLTVDWLWPIFTSATKPHVRRIVLSLIAELPWWDSAPLLITASARDDPNVHGHAVEHLHRWQDDYHRLSRPPTAAQAAALQRAMRLYGDRLDYSIRTDVEHHLKAGMAAIA